MTDIQLHNQISSLPTHLKQEVSDFVEFLLHKTKRKTKLKARIPGKAKGLVIMKDNFDDPIKGFEDYTR